MIKTSFVKLLELKNVKVKYEIVLATLKYLILSNNKKNLINCIPTIEYEVILLGITFNRIFIAIKRS